ncbi:nucleoside transporter family [Niveomyces insectorum RCEF 264]|uniref:Nucleoside transporter family n=1 Tax=Niveomyces insectorum RCEF 264 TaxID=1081102 RepID=A0A167M8Q1_9HYPO|nr:nucleoside transporter family [Niveomyces insectorum RCEF 264]
MDVQAPAPVSAHDAAALTQREGCEDDRSTSPCATSKRRRDEPASASRKSRGVDLVPEEDGIRKGKAGRGGRGGDGVDAEPIPKRAKIYGDTSEHGQQYAASSEAATSSPEPRRKENGSLQREKSPDSMDSAPGRRPSPVGYRATAVEPDVRDVRRKASVSQEERKRGQRLFGSLLSALSQAAGPASASRTGSRPGARAWPPLSHERQGVDRRQKDSDARGADQQQTAEDDQRHKARMAKLDRVRKVEQVKYDEQRMRTLLANELALAHNLRTKTKPVLYYRPWDLTREQEDIVEGQIQEAERRVSQQKRGFEREKQERFYELGIQYTAKSIPFPEEGATAASPPVQLGAEKAGTASDAITDKLNIRENRLPTSPGLLSLESKEELLHELQQQDEKQQLPHGSSETNRQDHEERDRDIMVENDEDMVIY